MAKQRAKKPFDPVAFAMRALRFKFSERKYLPRIQAYHRAARPYGMTECAKCNGQFLREKTQLDHMQPVEPIDGLGANDSLHNIAHRMYCPVDQLEVLCIQCHETKTVTENKARAVHRKLKKEKSAA